MSNDLEGTMQYILDIDGNLTEMLESDMVEVEFPIPIRVNSAFEVFVRVRYTENYWISNYGRCVNNLNRKDKNTFYQHKTGNAHITLYEIERYIKKRYKNKPDEWAEERYRRESTNEKLVAETFLKSYRGRDRIWHRDGDKNNNWYKNLIFVSDKDYKDLKDGNVLIDDLNLEQEYIEYKNKASGIAKSIYQNMRRRCCNVTDVDEINDAYKDVTLCDEWLHDEKAFVRWYLDHYYSVGDEIMTVDKDLFDTDDRRCYSPETCCILPLNINVMISSCKKRVDNDPEVNLPLGVRKAHHGKYFSQVRLHNGDDIKLSERDTPEEAFEEYAKVKKAVVCMMALDYKDKIPLYIYDALLDVTVRPYE